MVDAQFECVGSRCAELGRGEQAAGTGKAHISRAAGHGPSYISPDPGSRPRNLQRTGQSRRAGQTDDLIGPGLDTEIAILGFEH